MHAAGQGLVPIISIKVWISALEKSALLLHFEGVFILCVVLPALAVFFCLFFILEKGSAALSQAVSCQGLPSPAGVRDPQ